ncbi:testosterone-regulated protein rp2 [Holotrichia oblita]|uniref:Testosterone-regulated protein rp2 n=1 Tax=Holotrichia oblita TaxID=644536 RepID=A0ACB9TVM8_HOLOL|nr:testosterone-regulated protein rp2 [Holotrichia oblita]
MKTGSKIWREAASIMLVAKTAFTPTIKHTDFNYKLLTLQRSSTSGYMPGSYVFPGGVLCQADVSRDWIKLYESFGFKLNAFDKLNSKEYRPKLYQNENSDEIPKYLSLRIGAIRETFEESGVLICRSYKINYKERVARWASFIEEPELLKWQYKIHDDPQNFIELCRKYEVYPDVWALKEWSNWATPAVSPAKFDTAFYLTAFEELPPVHGEEKEVQKLEWASPTDYLIRNMKEELILGPPQVYEMSRLRTFMDIDELLKFASERSKEGVERYFPTRIKTKGGICTILPGDDLYSEALGEKMAYMEDLPATNVQNRMFHKSAYHNEISISNFQPKYNHIIPMPIQSGKL